MTFLEKLDCLMEKYGLNKRTLSQKSDIPYTTIDNWYKRGYEGLKLPTLRKLNNFFNTSLDFWILDEITDPNYGKSNGFIVDYDEMEYIKKYRFIRDHSPEGTKTIDYVLDREYILAERIAELEETRQPSTPDNITMPQLLKDDLIAMENAMSAMHEKKKGMTGKNWFNK